MIQVFWRFWAVSSKITFLQAIIALSVALFLLTTTFNSVVSSSQRRIFSILFFLPIFLFLFLAIRFDNLIGTGWSKRLAIGQLCFLKPKLLELGFFGSLIVSLHLSKSVLRRAITSRIVGVRIPDYDTRI